MFCIKVATQIPTKIYRQWLTNVIIIKFSNILTKISKNLYRIIILYFLSILSGHCTVRLAVQSYCPFKFSCSSFEKCKIKLIHAKYCVLSKIVVPRDVRNSKGP